MSADITYLDNNATTRVDPRVVDAMLPYFTEKYGNPSSLHQFGAGVAAELDACREAVASRIGARESELIFTSGGTESDNAAIRGVLGARPSRRHLIISAVEHSAVDQLATRLEQEGVAVTRIGVDEQGRLTLDELAAALRPDTALVSVMLANNETGVIYPLREVTRLAHGRNVPVHTDAVQALGRINVNVDELGVDLLSLSSHKIHGPKGVGALYVRRGTAFRPLLVGGPQERDRRGGTHNTAGIIGFAAACRLLPQPDSSEAQCIRALRDRMERSISERFRTAHIIGREADRLPNTTCVCFEGVEAEAVLMLLSEAGICASSGAACSSGSLEPSHVLKAMAVPPHVAQGQVRLSLGRFNGDEDIDRLIDALPAVLAKVAAVNVA
jgi:cysteine desulfurase